ncbi:MAG: nucleoside hydrolase-like domain-containing protein [Puniceicoccaceae bacterium]
MMKRFSILSYLCCLAIIIANLANFAIGKETLKPRIIVTTDIGQDPDDMQSMVRFLHYANEFRVEGIIVNADSNYEKEEAKLRPDIVHDLIDAYSEIRPNLNRVLPGFPTADFLHSVVKSGCAGNGARVPVENFIGEGKDTEGSDWIIEVVDRQSQDPVCISVWGGACDLAQALWKVRHNRTPEAVDRFVSKLRVYFIGKQDSSNQWIIDTFPKLWLILALDRSGDKWLSSYRGMFWGGDMENTSREWLHENIISKNPLAAMYPDKAYTGGEGKNPHGALKEGDSPSFLYFLPTGFNSIDQPHWGSWGGRFVRERDQFFRDASDLIHDEQVGKLVDSNRATVFRWRTDFQNDFVNRCDWGGGVFKNLPFSYEMLINSARFSGIAERAVVAGEDVIIEMDVVSNVSGSDIDHGCFFYSEAGSYVGDVVVVEERAGAFRIKIPEDAVGKKIHLVQRSVQKTKFPLVSYHRIILNVGNETKPARVIFDTDMGSDCDDVGALALLHAYADGGLVDILGCIYSSGKVPYGAGVIDAINVYYGRPAIPVGASHDLSFGDPVDKMSAEKLARDQSAYGNRIVHNKDTAEQTNLNRKILASQPDNSVTYITVGHTKALYELLKSAPDKHSHLNGMQLAKAKLCRWVALGGLRSNNPERHRTQDWNFFRNDTAKYTDYLLENFPRPVYIIDAGSKTMTGASLKETPPGNIVRDAYEVWLKWHDNRTLADQRPSWDLIAVYYAVNGIGEFLEEPLAGQLDFDPEEGSLWIGNTKGTHFLVGEKEDLIEPFAGYLNSQIARKPGN